MRQGDDTFLEVLLSKATKCVKQEVQSSKAIDFKKKSMRQEDETFLEVLLS